MILLNEFDKNNFELNFSINNFINKHKSYVPTFVYNVMKYSHKNPDLLKKYKINFSNLIFALQQVIKTNELSVNLSQAIIREMSKDEKISLDIKAYSSLLKKREELLKIESIEEKEIKNISTSVLPSDYTMVIAIRDVDLAGDLSLVSYFGNQKLVRVIADEQPPRLNISYAILDKDGNEITSNAEIITDKKFRFRTNRNNGFAHERRTLRQWLTADLKERLKS